MTTFLERWRGRAKSLATFGDSITAGNAASAPERRWASLLATALGVERLHNAGISGAVLQRSLVDGRPRENNGVDRFRRDLLGPDRADVIAICYGFNDARQISPSFTRERFAADYREVLAGLFEAGYDPEAICLGSPPHIPDAGFAVGDDGFAGQSRQTFQSYVRAVEDIARDADTFYAPVNEHMGAEDGDSLVSADHVHPNDAGHTRIAEIFAGATRLAQTTEHHDHHAYAQ